MDWKGFVAVRASKPWPRPGQIAAWDCVCGDARVECRDEGAAAEQSGILCMSVAALSERAQTGDAMPRLKLGRRYGLGLASLGISTTSFSWYEKAQTRVFVAQANLAYMYLNGEGVRKDGKLAEEVVRQGCRARVAIARKYALGLHVHHRLGRGEARAHRREMFLMAANQATFPRNGR